MIPHNQWVNRPEYEAAVLRVLRSGHAGQGPEVEAFERELAERFRPGGAAACVSSGTAALRLAITSLTDHGMFLTVPTYACSALWHAMRNARRSPRLTDVMPDNFNARFATVGVHTYGVPCPGAYIEDFSHAPGGTLDEKPCGSIGKLSIISFGATKPLGIGQGGAVLGPADAIEEVKDRINYDQKQDLGERFNFQLSDVMAAIGRERLKRLDEENEWRASTANYYEQARPDDGVYLQAEQNRTDEGRVWYRYVIRVKDVAATIRHFAAHGIEVINPLRPDELLHRKLGLDPADFPNAEAIAASTVSLPIWPGMLDSQVDQVAEALSELEA